MGKEEIDVRVGDIWRDAYTNEHWLIFDRYENNTEDRFWVVCLDPDPKEFKSGFFEEQCVLIPKSFKHDTLIYREYSADYDVPLCEVKDSMKDLGEMMSKAVTEGRSFTAEQVENMTLKELGLQVKGRENDAWGTVGVYIEVPNSPDVCLNLKHTTLKGATVIVTESFAV